VQLGLDLPKMAEEFGAMRGIFQRYFTFVNIDDSLSIETVNIQKFEINCIKDFLLRAKRNSSIDKFLLDRLHAPKEINPTLVPKIEDLQSEILIIKKAFANQSEEG
jgi:hypothetical protein